MKALKWRDDENLTEQQRQLKRQVYDELSIFEDIGDIEPMLKSLLKDIELEKGGQYD